MGASREDAESTVSTPHCAPSAQTERNEEISDYGHLMVDTRPLHMWLGENKSSFRVLVMHHPVDWLVEWAQVELEALTAKLVSWFAATFIETVLAACPNTMEQFFVLRRHRSSLQRLTDSVTRSSLSEIQMTKYRSSIASGLPVLTASSSAPR